MRGVPDKRIIKFVISTGAVWATFAHPARADDPLKAALGDFFCYEQHWDAKEYTTPKPAVLQGTMHKAGGITRLYFKGNLFEAPADDGTSEIDISKVHDEIDGVFDWQWVPSSVQTKLPELHDMLMSGTPFSVDLSSYRCQQNALTDPVYGPILIKALVAEARSLGGAAPGSKFDVTIPDFSIRDSHTYVMGGGKEVYEIGIRSSSDPLSPHDFDMAGRPIMDADNARIYRQIILAGKHIVR